MCTFCLGATTEIELIIKTVTDLGQECRTYIVILEDIRTHITVYQLEGIIKTVSWHTTLL